MISELRLSQIIATITELSEEKKRDLYKFLIELKEKTDSIPDDKTLDDIKKAIQDILRALGNKVDKVSGKGLSTNDFTNELRQKLVTIEGNVQANWNQTDETKPDYIVNKPNLDNIGVQSDWNEDDVTSPSYIKNKPTIPSSPDLNGYEVIQNKVISLSAQSTDDEYPSAKCVYDIVGDIESVLNNILGI